MRKEIKKVPTIRFRGFTEDWEQRKFGELAIRESETGISSQSMPGVEYADIISETGKLNKDISQKTIHKKGIQFNGTQILYGKLRPYLHNWVNPMFKGIAVGDWWVLTPVKTDKNFLYRLIQTKQFDDVANQSVGSKMPRADWNLISDSEFAIPNQIKEQQMIGDYFHKLDNLITLHQRKFDELKTAKTYFLQNMFPAKGEKVPRIRFHGFTGDWEQRKLGEIGSTFTGLSGKTKEDFGHGDARFVTYMNVYSNSIADLAMTERVEIDQTQNSVKYGDIFFTTSSETPNEVGMSSVWLGNTENTYLNSFCFGYRPEVKVNPYYMAYMLRSPNVRNKLIILAQGISRYNISKNRVMDIEVPTPDLSEQKEIGQYFLNLDNLITLHQHKLDQLKTLKKFMLQNLFI